MSGLDRILRHLPDAKRHGERWHAHCPAHDDHDPSLVLWEEADGWPKVKCFAGCEDTEVLKALGLTWKDVAPDETSGRNGSPSSRPRIVATYPYLDERGTLLFEVVRYHPKGFRQRRPDGRGGWTWDLNGVRRVLYHMPDVLDAVGARKPVWIVEGEKDADALASIGLCGTTSPQGAGKWQLEYGDALRGAHIVVLPDNDDPGRSHADTIARALQGVAHSVRIINLPGLPPKGDVSEWLAQGGTAADLRQLAKAAPVFDPSTDTLEPGGVVEDEWPEPESLDDFTDPPPFPTDALPEPIRSFVEATAEQTQTPTDLPALLALGALATACARTARIVGTPGWSEPLNAFACVALPSGSRKSAVVRACAAPIEAFETEECERVRPEVARAIAERQTLEARLQAATKKAATAKGPDRMATETDRDQVARDLAEMPIEHLPRLLADDATPEVLARLMAEQQGRIACLSAEGSILFEQAAGRYSENGSRLETYLMAHAGDTLRVDRVQRRAEHIREPALTLCLTVQPSVLSGAMARPEFRGRGLLARFLWSVPKPTIGYRKLVTDPVPTEVNAAYAETLLRLLRRRPADDPPSLALSPEAARTFLDYRNRCESALRPGERFEHVQDWASKLPGVVLRIAGLLHLTEYADDAPVSRQTIEGAIRIGEYAEAHALLAFGMMGAEPIRAKAERLLRWIASKRLPEFTSGQAYRENRAHFEKPGEVIDALDMLVDLGYLREITDRAAVGRPTRRFKVSPHALRPAARYARNAHNTVEGPPFVHSVQESTAETVAHDDSTSFEEF